MQEKVLECVLLECLQAANFFEALLVSVHFWHLHRFWIYHTLLMIRLLLDFILNLVQQVTHRTEIRQSFLLWLLRFLTSGSCHFTIHFHITICCCCKLLCLHHSYESFLLLFRRSDCLLSLKKLFLHQALVHKLCLLGESLSLAAWHVPRLAKHSVSTLNLIVGELHRVLLTLRVRASQLVCLPLFSSRLFALLGK